MSLGSASVAAVAAFLPAQQRVEAFAFRDPQYLVGAGGLPRTARQIFNVLVTTFAGTPS